MTLRRATWLLLMVGASARSQEPVWAILKDSAEVRGLTVQLSDIAEVGSTDPAARARARAYALCPPPPPGQARLLMAQTVSALIDKVRGSDPAVTLRGAPALRLHSSSVSLSGEEVSALARRALLSTLGARAAAARLEPTSNPAALVAPAGRFSTHFEVQPPKDSDPAGLVHLVVQAVVDGAPCASTPVSFVVRRAKPVLVARSDLAPGRPVEAAQVGAEVREIDAGLQGLVASHGELQGLLPKARIPAGSVLSVKDFRRPPLINRNDPVMVQVRCGNLTVRGEGVALQEGSSGDRIPVRTVPGRQLVQALIVDSRTVEMLLDPVKGTP